MVEFAILATPILAEFQTIKKLTLIDGAPIETKCCRITIHIVNGSDYVGAGITLNGCPAKRAAKSEGWIRNLFIKRQRTACEACSRVLEAEEVVYRLWTHISDAKAETVAKLLLPKQILYLHTAFPICKLIIGPDGAYVTDSELGRYCGITR